MSIGLQTRLHRGVIRIPRHHARHQCQRFDGTGIGVAGASEEVWISHEFGDQFGGGRG